MSVLSDLIYRLRKLSNNRYREGDVANAINSLNEAVKCLALSSITTPEEFGAESAASAELAVIDASDAINKALSAAENGLTVTGADGAFYCIKSPIIVKKKANLRNINLVVGSGFVGNSAIEFGESGDPYMATQGVQNIFVEGSTANIGCYHVKNVQRVFFDNIKCQNFGGTLWRCENGYELTGTNFNLSGNIPPLTASPQTSIGFLHETNDSSYANVKVSRVGTGFKITGGGNRFVNTHAWSTYFLNATKMTVCYLIQNRTNIFVSPTADSPARIDWGQPNSLANGGYGFYIDTSGSDVELINPYIYASQYGDSLPTAASIIPVYSDRSRIVIDNPKAVNDTGVPGIYTDFAVFSATARIREATISGFTGGGQVTMPENMYIGGSFTQATPDLLIGGASTGITYGNRRSMFKRTGSLFWFNINMNLTSKGALTGALTLTLPVTSFNENPDYRVVFQCFIANQNGTAVPVVATLGNNTSTISLINSETGANISDANITNTSRITITGCFITSTL